MRWGVVTGVAGAALVAGAVLAWTAIGQDREFQRLIDVGDAALAQDQTFTAIEAFSGALALKSDSMLAYLKRGDTYQRRGELASALRDLREASSLEPTAPQPMELLGDVNAGMGRYARAIEDYERFIALDDRSPRVLYKLAHTYYRSGQAALALEPLREALALDARLSEAQYLLGLCLRQAGRQQDAVEALTQALAINPALVAAREELALLYAEMHRDRDSLEQIEALAALEPGRPERMIRVGLAHARQGRIEAALATLGRAAERFPEDPAVYTALGRLWLDGAGSRNDRVAIGKALGALQRAAARPGAGSETLAFYGRALDLSGDAAAAERTLQQATTLLPVEPLAYRYLADAATRLRHTTVARDAERRYAALTAP